VEPPHPGQTIRAVALARAICRFENML